ncbi:MAG: DUF4149 domain-containing protein [Nitrospirae bacterium]|nr:DUF4149 domain-containing protein [Nitrospirota bacterium]
MKRFVIFFVWLELAGLGVWVGGMLTLGALVAPTVFNTVKPVEMAGAAMSLVFRRFNGGFVYACIILVVLGFLGKWFPAKQRGKRFWIEGGLLAVMVLSGLYIGVVLGPRMQELRQIRLADPSNGMAVAEFDRGHRTSETLFSVNLLLGLAVLWMNTGAPAVPDRREPS